MGPIAAVQRRQRPDAETLLVERDLFDVRPQVELVGNEQAVSVPLGDQQSANADTEPDRTRRVLSVFGILQAIVATASSNGI